MLNIAVSTRKFTSISHEISEVNIKTKYYTITILGITEEKKVSILDNFLDLGRNTLPDNLFQAAFLTVSRKY